MKVAVQLLSPTRALVALKPSRLARFFLGATEETRHALRHWSGWQYVLKHQFMSRRVEEALIEASKAALRERQSAS